MADLYNGFYSQSVDILPIQTVPLKEKLADGKDGSKSWKEKCMDSLETIGRRQYSYNLRLIENYEMIKGRFIFSHYFQTEGYSDMISQLSADFELPNYLRHYDIIGQVVNTMVGEWTKKPDLFKIRQLGDGASNEYLRKKLDLTKQYVFSRINAEINQKLIEQGLDPNKNDFQNQQQQNQYEQQINQARQQLIPKEIQEYMDTDFLTIAEIWAEHQYQYDRENFNLAEKEKDEFTDMLVADRCYRHFYIGPTGHMQETWNPINVFSHKSPDIKYTEDGDYVGRIFNLTLNTIIDRYGHLMKKDDLDLLIKNKSEGDKQWNDSQFNWVYDNYLMPFNGYPTYDIMKNSWNVYKNGEIPFLDDKMYKRLTDNDYFSLEGFYFVTEAYWKTQKKIIKLTYIDPDTQEIVVDIVDENFIIPKEFVESRNIFSEQHDINTYCETYVNEVWKGIKINSSFDRNLNKDLYLAVGPNDFQFKGDINIYGCKLPVCGQEFSKHNSSSASMVDMMKPHQIGFNVAMNQLYQLAEKEIGMFLVMDVNMFPNAKDWGGENAWEKWMLMAKNLGLLPADTSPQNIQNNVAATGGYLPKVLDLSLASQMVSRMNLAKFYEEQALKQVGFNDYRLGSFNQSSTATGVQTGMAQSYSQTDSYFTNFSNYLRRCNQMDIDIAQYVQSQKETITITYVKSDLNRAFIKVLGTDLLLTELGVRVSNSQEHTRQLEMIRQFALNNNTSGLTPPDVANIIMMNDPAEIKRQLEVSYNRMFAQQQQAQQQQIAVEQQKAQDDKINKELDRENELNVARIKAGADIINSPLQESIQNQQIPQESDQLKREVAINDQNLKREKLDLEKQRLAIETDYNAQKLANEQKKTDAALQIQREQTETARIMKGKPTNKK